MKKKIFITLVVILVPYLIVSLVIKNTNNKFNFVSNMIVRVKKENGEIIEVPFEEYTLGVLAGEMPVSFELEALKAQAVAARSYVLKKMEQNKNENYDILDTVMNQVYVSDENLKEKLKDKYEENINKLKRAIKETTGEYLTYNDEIVEAFFFSTSTGKTENSEDVFVQALPYLRSVDSNWDSKVSPVFNETINMSLEEFYQKLNLNYNDSLNIEITETTSTGRIKKIKINNKEFSGNEISNSLNLRSTFFDIKQIDDSIYITTTGYGHGVGMSQYGAHGMAKEGYTYDQILKHYYQGIEISKM